MPAGATISTASECAVTCGVISAPATSIATISGTSDAAGRGSHHRHQHGERRRAAPAGAGAAGAATAQRVGDTRHHRRDRPRREQHPAEGDAAGRRGDGRDPDLHRADDEPEAQRRQRHRPHAGPGDRAEHPGRRAGRGAPPRRPARRGSARTRAPTPRRAPATTTSPVPGHGAGHQERRERRTQDEEHLHADRLVGVRGARRGPGGQQRGPQRAGRTRQRRLHEPGEHGERRRAPGPAGHRPRPPRSAPTRQPRTAMRRRAAVGSVRAGR